MMWRFEEAGYLRRILTARVYDVAVRSCFPGLRVVESACSCTSCTNGTQPATSLCDWGFLPARMPMRRYKCTWGLSSGLAYVHSIGCVVLLCALHGL